MSKLAYNRFMASFLLTPEDHDNLILRAIALDIIDVIAAEKEGREPGKVMF